MIQSLYPSLPIFQDSSERKTRGGSYTGKKTWLLQAKHASVAHRCFAYNMTLMLANSMLALEFHWSKTKMVPAQLGISISPDMSA
ncbi:UNVERIFIED_CONTAM: hypothetical protein K2H54_061412 [Gekko kuhli]